MPLISKVIQWDVFSTPPIEPVQYYSILKKKREFSLLIQQCDSQVLKLGYLHYCCIVPKDNRSSLCYKYDIFIVFFSEIPSTSFIGFRVKVDKDTFVFETNLLLLLLKNSNKSICYFMNNNCIHVKCSISDAWELFYFIYREYLKRYVITVIGTRFFYSFTYLYFIQIEKQLLEMLYKGSKTVKISKKSVFYKIYRKCQVSVSELIHITHNMPMSCFRFKQVPLVLKTHKSHLCIKNNSPYFPQQNKNKQYPHVFNKQSDAVPQKRKFEEIDAYIDNSKDYEDWEKYSDFKPFSINSYSNTPSLKNVIPMLLKNGENQICSDFFLSKRENHEEDYSQNEILTSKVSVNEVDTKVSTFAVKKLFTKRELKSEERERDNKNYGYPPSTSTNIFSRNALVRSCNNENIANEREENESFFGINEFLCKKKMLESCNVSNQFDTDSCAVENLNEEHICDNEDVSFTTAGGKYINVSNSAMLVAQKIMENMLTEEKRLFEGEREPNFTSFNKKRKYPDSNAFQGNSCSSKKLLTAEVSDVDMNGTLVEKFFEDSSFEGKEIESNECVTIKNPYVDAELNKIKNLPNYKPRKSLGGRISVKYSDKL